MGPGLRRLAAAFTLATAFALCWPGRASCETATAADDSFIVAVAEFTGKGLPRSMDLFSSALPRLLLAELSVLPLRLDSESYLAEKARLQASRDIFALGTELASRLDELAQKRLEPGVDAFKRSRDLVEAERKAAEALAKLDPEAVGRAAVRGTAPGEGPAPPKPRSALISPLNDGGALVRMDAAGPVASIHGKKIDFLVYGELEAIGSYAAVDLMVYDSATGRTVLRARSYGDPSDPSPLARELAEKVCALVAGRPYARVDFRLSPDSASLSVGGQELDSRQRRLYVYGEQSLVVVASAPGRGSLTSRIDLVPGDRKVVDLSLAELSTGTATISTSPSGLSVHVDGLPVGLSPVQATLRGERSVVTAYSGDAASATAVLPASGEPVIVLEPSASAREAARLVSQKRDEFYDALGWLVLSLPLTSMTYGLNTQYADAYIRGGDASMLTAYRSSGIALGVLGAASAGLAVNAIIRLVRYIAAAH